MPRGSRRRILSGILSTSSIRTAARQQVPGTRLTTISDFDPAGSNYPQASAHPARPGIKLDD
eukprot:1841632-Alexandrium_andersonii.AAC.1